MDKKLTIRLSNRAPVKITESEWEIIGTANDFEGEHEFQSNRKWRLKVRQHADGRVLVYGHKSSNYQNEGDIHAGYLLVNDKQLVESIRQVADEIGSEPQLARECVGSLPATEI